MEANLARPTPERLHRDGGIAALAFAAVTALGCLHNGTTFPDLLGQREHRRCGAFLTICVTTPAFPGSHSPRTPPTPA